MMIECFLYYIKYVYKVTTFRRNHQTAPSFLTVLKIKNLKFGSKVPRFAILASFSRGYR